jgi:hypothetical protein
VDKYVFGAITLDEAKAFCLVEPLYDALFSLTHVSSSFRFLC